MSDGLKIEVQCSTSDNSLFDPNSPNAAELRDSLAHSLNIAVETVMASKDIGVKELDVVVQVGQVGFDYCFGPIDFISGTRDGHGVGRIRGH